MSRIAPVPISNRLISQLSRRERVALLADCETIQVRFGEILCEPGHDYAHVYFPLTSFISLMAKVDGHPPLELGLIGNEGMLGASLLLGVREVPLRAVVQGAGDLLRLPAKRFREHAKEGSGLSRILNRYLFVTTAQLAQSTLCTRFHEIEPRLARWLLLTHDRAHADHFHLTHQYLADMLGVQRSAITIAAGNLQSNGLIRYTRGEINILDREGLESVACECYSATVQDYAQRLA